MIQKLAWVFGVVFIAFGILGFVPGITSGGYLLGIFQVDGLHNIIHLLSGLVAIFAARASVEYARLYFQVFGVVYGLVTVIGFLEGDTVLGLISVNAADNVLHILIAAVALYAGFWLKESGSTSASTA